MKYQVIKTQVNQVQDKISSGLWLGIYPQHYIKGSYRDVLVLVNEYAKTVVVLDHKSCHNYDGGDYWSDFGFEITRKKVVPLPVGQKVEFWNDKEIKK